jgi:minor ampullate silk protein miSp1 (fragment)
MAASLSTENYDRLTKVARLDYSDQDASLLDDLKAQLASLKTACASFSGNTGVEGATHAAMTSRVSDFEASIANLEGRVGTMETAHTQARQAMQEAKSVQGTLSTQLSHPSDQAAAQVIFQGQPNEAALQNEYIQNMIAQRNAQREAKAKAALDAMNGEVSSAAAGFAEVPSNGDGDSNGGGGSSSGATAAGSRGGTQYAAGGGAGVGSAASGGPIAGLEVLPSVSPSSSVLAGVDVTTMPVGGYMTPDGPAGGHIPAPVTDADDPRWKPDYNPFSTSSHSKDLAIAGGALTTGGTLAGLGRMATSATSIAGSMGGFASRAATSQFGTVPAGGALAPSTSARLSSSNAISSAMNDLERGALTPRGTAQAGNWGNAARMANPGTPASTAARAGGFPRGMGAPGAYGSGATAGTGAGTSSTASNASTMSARARAAASIRPAGVSGTTATGAPANGAAAGARGTASSAAKGAASVKAGTGSQSAATSARSASASAARAGVGARPGVMGTTAGAASSSTSTAKGSATKGASAKAASSAKTSSAGTGAARGASSNGNVSGDASSAAARGASAAAARGPIGTGAVAGAASKEEKDKAKRRALSGLKAVRVEGVDEKAPAAAGLSAGNAESLKPVAAADQDDRW